MRSRTYFVVRSIVRFAFWSLLCLAGVAILIAVDWAAWNAV